MRWDDVQFTRGYDKWLAYGQSKTANALFALHLDKLGREHGVRAFSLHPGKIFTPLQRHLTRAEMTAAGWLDASGQPADPSFKTVQQGAATEPGQPPRRSWKAWAACTARIATSPRWTWAKLPPSPACARTRSIQAAARLWALSAGLTGIDAFAAR